MKPALSVITIFALCLVMLGCSSPEKRAQKLFDQGKYEIVIAYYPNLPIAKKAKDKIAEHLLAIGLYDEILKNYADTPSAAEATNKIAERLIKAGFRDQVLQKYPDHLRGDGPGSWAEDLFRGGEYDKLTARYPNTPAGLRWRNFIAQNQWNRIDELKGEERTSALEEFLKDPKYQGTDAAVKAQQEINKIEK
jgi:hypothetical protein